MITQQQLPVVERLFQTLQILVIVASDADKRKVTAQLAIQPLDYNAQLLTVEEALNEVNKANLLNA